MGKDPDQRIQTLAQWMNESRHLVVFTLDDRKGVNDSFFADPFEFHYWLADGLRIGDLAGYGGMMRELNNIYGDLKIFCAKIQGNFNSRNFGRFRGKFADGLRKGSYGNRLVWSAFVSARPVKRSRLR